jgi:hypothetical protein
MRNKGCIYQAFLLDTLNTGYCERREWPRRGRLYQSRLMEFIKGPIYFGLADALGFCPVAKVNARTFLLELHPV